MCMCVWRKIGVIKAMGEKRTKERWDRERRRKLMDWPAGGERENADKERDKQRGRERNTVLPRVACPECPVYEAVNRPGSMCALQTLPHVIDKSVCVNERSWCALMYHDTTMSLGHTHTHTQSQAEVCMPTTVTLSFLFCLWYKCTQIFCLCCTHTHTNLSLLDEHLAPVLQKILRVLFYPVNRREEGFHSSSSRQSEDKTSYTGFALISNRRLNILIRSYQPCLHTQAQSRGEIISLLHTLPKLS